MADGKYTMYVSVVHQSINMHQHDSPYEFEVQIPKDYVEIFNHLFDQTNELEFINFLRAHLPYVPYHYDRDNHKIDRRLHKVYALIHEFTDKDSQAFIEDLPFFRQPVTR
ncbi:transposase [Sporosarcina aquimarina]|uniref:Transposase n=1 Tax=Sporosarcina aquimarina TaxID=114975 RepID=A0ABU4FZQ0_9BACL|nr:transposase [Sporosarcina aquimarina]MDW0110187.1 transposase [Sporosarcina aquimarina]